VVLCGRVQDCDVLQAFIYLSRYHPGCQPELWTDQPKGRLIRQDGIQSEKTVLVAGFYPARPIPTRSQLQGRWFPSSLHWSEWVDIEPGTVHEIHNCEDSEGREDLIDFIGFKQTQLTDILGLGRAESTVFECEQQQVVVAKEGQRGLFLLGLSVPYNTAKPEKEPALEFWRGRVL
jgi:hypothetical protein